MKPTQIVSILLCLTIISCAYTPSTVKTTYDTLKVSQTTYDTSMKIISNLYTQGLIPDSNLQPILSTASTYHKAHNTAVAALLSYERTKSLSSLDLLNAQISIVTTSLSSLLTLIKPYIGDN